MNFRRNRRNRTLSLNFPIYKETILPDVTDVTDVTEKISNAYKKVCIIITHTKKIIENYFEHQKSDVTETEEFKIK